jgi:hypothetical protein
MVILHLDGGGGPSFVFQSLSCVLMSHFFFYRACPGSGLAVQSVFLVLSNLAYFFDIEAIPGVTVDTYAYTTGFNVRILNAQRSTA